MKWEIVHTSAGWHIRLRADNGEPIVTSEVYENADRANNALRLVRRSIAVFSALQPDIVDERQERERKVWIVARTRYAARHYAASNGFTDWRHVITPDNIRGINDPVIHILGYPEGWSSEAISEFNENLRYADRGNAVITHVGKKVQ